MPALPLDKNDVGNLSKSGVNSASSNSPNTSSRSSTKNQQTGNLNE